MHNLGKSWRNDDSKWWINYDPEAELIQAENPTEGVGESQTPAY